MVGRHSFARSLVIGPRGRDSCGTARLGVGRRVRTAVSERKTTLRVVSDANRLGSFAERTMPHERAHGAVLHRMSFLHYLSRRSDGERWVAKRVLDPFVLRRSPSEVKLLSVLASRPQFFRSNHVPEEDIVRPCERFRTHERVMAYSVRRPTSDLTPTLYSMSARLKFSTSTALLYAEEGRLDAL